MSRLVGNSQLRAHRNPTVGTIFNFGSVCLAIVVAQTKAWALQVETKRLAWRRVADGKTRKKENKINNCRDEREKGPHQMIGK
jgi:hypothetical protein